MVALIIAVGLYFGVGAARQYSADRDYHPIPIPTALTPPPAPAAALAGLVAPAKAPALAGPDQSAPVPTAAGVIAKVQPALAAAGLGPSVAAQVFDAATGAALLNQGASMPVAPASTAKLLTAAALLEVHKVSDRFATRVVAGATAGSIVLVGGGDPTLSAAGPGEAPAYPEAARISDLADQVKAKLGGAAVTSVSVDDSLFTGPATAVGWDPEDAPSTYASEITATMVDGGRDTPQATSRSANPALAAGQALASDLAANGSRPSVAVGAGQIAPTGAATLAAVYSAPVGTLIEQMLSESDNVLAEVLARQVAVAVKQPASFVGAAAAIASSLKGLGIAVGSGMKDGSGLSGLDRVPAGVLGQTLLKAVAADDPRLHPIVAGLSVAGWDGTLVEQDRFAGAAAAAYGVVRAKTGSLTGVSALSGLLTDQDGRLLVFSFVADAVPGGDPDSVAARLALDQAAASLATCGCR